MMRQASDRGFQIYLVYVALSHPDLHIERVRLRVALGGHDVPEGDIRRRYARSLAQAPKALQLADEAVVLDNSGVYPRRILSLRQGHVIWEHEALPEWGQDLRKRLR